MIQNVADRLPLFCSGTCVCFLRFLGVSSPSPSAAKWPPAAAAADAACTGVIEADDGDLERVQEQELPS